MSDLPPAALERIAREFAPADRLAVQSAIAAYMAEPGVPPELCTDLLDAADGDPERLWSALRLARIDWRDLRVGVDAERVVRQLVATGGRGPVTTLVLGRDDVMRVCRDYERSRPRAERCFPADQVGAVMVLMGASFPANAEELFAAAHGNADRLAAILAARTAGEADPTTPPALAALPLMAAELIRRGFAPERWEEAARVAARAPRRRGVGGALEWLLLAEYAGGDLDDLRWAIRMAWEDYGALTAGVARRRQERRDAGKR